MCSRNRGARPNSPCAKRARTRALLRRTKLPPPGHKPKPYHDGYLTVDLDRQRVRMLAGIAILWTVALVAPYWLVWPSMWSQPLKTLGVTFGGMLYYEDTPHESPLFFLGRS